MAQRRMDNEEASSNPTDVLNHADCPEDCPRCNRCPPSDPRRLRIDGLITKTELEKERYEADRLQALLPLMDWHELVLKALAK